MHEIFNMLLAVFDRAALMLFCLFFLIRIRLFRELLHKSAHSPKELLAVTAIFSMFALFSTWSGVPVEGSLVNVRIIAVMSGGILFGPWVGIITGVIMRYSPLPYRYWRGHCRTVFYHQYSGGMYRGLDKPENPKSTALARGYFGRDAL